MNIDFFTARDVLAGKVRNVDYHMHSDLTDGRDTVTAMAMGAEALGLNAIAFTEHAADHSDWIRRLPEIKASVEALGLKVRVYWGAEVKLLDWEGKLALSHDKIGLFDFIVGVIHRYPQKTGGFHDFSALTAGAALEIDYALNKILLENPDVDVWGHPAGVYAHYFGRYPEKELNELIDLAIERRVAVEINSQSRYRCVTDLIWSRLAGTAARISLGSDAHSVGEIGQIGEFIAAKMEDAHGA